MPVDTGFDPVWNRGLQRYLNPSHVASTSAMRNVPAYIQGCRNRDTNTMTTNPEPEPRYDIYVDVAALVEEGTVPEVGCDFDATEFDKDVLCPSGGSAVGDAVIATPDLVGVPTRLGVDSADADELGVDLEPSAFIPKPIYICQRRFERLPSCDLSVPIRSLSKSKTVYTFFRNTSPSNHWSSESKACRPMMLLSHILPPLTGFPM